MQSETLCHFMPNIWKSSLLIIPTRDRMDIVSAVKSPLPFSLLSALLKAYQEKSEIDEDAYRQVAEECRKIIVAADGLLASGNENRPLITEIRPWLIQFKQVGEYGAEVLNMIRLRQQKDAFIGSYEHARALLVLMGETDAQYKAGIKSGSLHLMPTFNALFEAATTGYNAAFHAGLDTKAVYSPTR